MSPSRGRVVAAALLVLILSMLEGLPVARAGKHLLSSRVARAEAAFARGRLPRGSAYAEAEGELLRVVVDGVGDVPPLQLDAPGWRERLAALAPRRRAAGSRPALVMKLDTAQRLETELQSVMREFDVWAFDAVNAPLRLRTLPVGTTLELTPSLYMPLGRTRIPYDLPWVLERRLAPERIRIMDAFGPDHVDATLRLAQAAGTYRTAPIERLLDETGAVSLRGHEGDILIIVGHVEQDSFVIRNASGNIVRSLPLEQIKAEAARRSASAIFVGCNSYCATGYNGLVAPISDIAVSQQLEGALKEATLGGFLSRLGTPDEPFVVTPDSLRANRTSIDFSVSRVSKKKAAAAAAGVVVVGVTASRWIEHGAPEESELDEPRPAPPKPGVR